MNQYIIKTFGCKANMTDSQFIEAELKKKGWTPFRGNGDELPLLYVINSCTVTNEANKQAKRALAGIKKSNPNSIVVVTGCAAEIDRLGFGSSCIVAGNRDKPRLTELIIRKFEERLGCRPHDDNMQSHVEVGWPAVGETVSVFRKADNACGKTRGFLKIQEGCNARCAYCAVPFARGPSRSLEVPQVIKFVREIVNRGAKEVVFTGINLGQYKDESGDRRTDLLTLVKRVLDETAVARLRISSLDPTEITSGFVKLVESDKRFCPHFHVSLQSVSDGILASMKRRYRFSAIKDCLDMLKSCRPFDGGGPVFIGMDVMTGFPGEADNVFDEVYRLLSKLPWDRLHVFPFSERANTLAVGLPGNVPVSKRKMRAKELNRLSLKRLVERYTGVINSVLKDVLVESISNKPPRGRMSGSYLNNMLIKPSLWATGHTGNYTRVVIPIEATNGRQVQSNEIVKVTLKGLVIDEQGFDVSVIGEI
ncbi:MAG: MiaB/RimO family radical SAM methylthiotransferase [Bdellovibrionota bacterium]